MRLEEEVYLRLISDSKLYPMAEEFVARHGSFASDEQGRKQVNSLVKYAREGILELEKFSKKQLDRDWQGRKEHYKSIYKSLLDQLRILIDLARDNNFISKELPNNKAHTSEAVNYLVQEFIQHLAAEMLYPKGEN